MRRLVLAMLVFAAASCSGEVAPTPTAPIVPTSTTTSAATTTTSHATTTTLAPTTTTLADGVPVVDMIPSGTDIEDFVPLVENYFTVRNWALEHPSEATEEILATVIEPGSAEMETTMAEIQDLVDQGAHYEGLTETFVLVSYHLVQVGTDIPAGRVSLGVTVQYGDTSVTSESGEAIAADTLRRAPWTFDLGLSGDGAWLVNSIFRNPFDHAPGTP
jgi:hypothetical protein